MADSKATEVPVKLSDEELLERGENLAVKMLHIETLRTKKKNDAKRTQGLIDEELEEAARLARVITGQEEARKQGDLFVGDQVATEALAKVGAAACTCDDDRATPLDPETGAAIDCPVHGVDARPADSTAEAPTPIDGRELAEDPGPDGDQAEPFPEGDAA